eukprot:CAMPEP_0197006876 /NCGR_PEP_ID=MMETSP1380-20130617/37659_1 /TAXON_ID=5936 /ORGANISM="Euplotes crassus, Strain CT5" /LENGTH=207 /DNA_ID=CAMNT_0042426705 /DNA_START=92 /DNA_END=715 /DNA_ORIENTATION=+
MKTPVSKEKIISFKSPMIRVKKFQEDRASDASSSSSAEYTPSPTNHRREIASKVIGITYFDTSKYSNSCCSNVKPGPVSSFSTKKSSTKIISKNSTISKPYLDSSSDDNKSFSSDSLSWDEGKSENPYSNVYDNTKSKRFNEILRRKSHYLIHAPVKKYLLESSNSDKDSSDSDGESHSKFIIGKFKKFSPSKKKRRMTVKFQELKI